MNSHPLPELLHAYADGELDVAHTLEVERHLEVCPECARACGEIRTLRDSLTTALPRFVASDALRARVRAAVPGQPPRRPRLPGWLVPAAAVLLVVIGGAGLIRIWPASSGESRIAREVVDSHIRSQLAAHLLDVESSDGHTVKPWFQGKLDFSPAVIDLDDEGFVLAGGRMDYIDGRPVAALVYRRKKHLVNLLVWPAPPGEQEAEPRSETKQGYHLVRWCRRGMIHWAVSDLNPDEMGEFARLIGNRE